VRRWRDSTPNQRGGNARGSGDAPIAGPRRRAGPQAVHVRRGETRGSFHEDDETRSRVERGGRRRTRAQPSLPGLSNLSIQPRILAVAGAVAVVLIIAGTFLSRGPAPQSSTPEATPGAVAVTTSTPVGATPIPTQGPIQATIVPLEPTYTVQSGDTLAIIARRYSTSVDALVSINNLENRNSLRVGQRLIIPNQ
jgi:LysM repeat protein